MIHMEQYDQYGSKGIEPAQIDTSKMADLDQIAGKTDVSVHALGSAADESEA